MSRSFRGSLKDASLLGLGLLVAGTVVAGGLLVGCTEDGPGPQSAKNLGLPPWTGPARDMFADEIDPSAMGILPAKPAHKDQALWARAQQADIVGRVRVQTVTVDSRGGDGTYHLVLRFANPLLAASRLEERDFEVTVDATDPSYGLVKAQDTGLQGKTFVGFLKRFGAADDEVHVHFYLAADSADVAAVVQEAVAVQEVTNK